MIKSYRQEQTPYVKTISQKTKTFFYQLMKTEKRNSTQIAILLNSMDLD